MIAKKIQFFLRQIVSYIKAKFAVVNINMFFGAVFYILLVTVLAINGYTAYNRGMDNLQRIHEEQAKTDELQKKNDELRSLYKYYSSIDYKKIYARDNLNMAEKNETLYYIEKHEEVDIEQLTTKIVPKKVDNLILWRKLLFGV